MRTSNNAKQCYDSNLKIFIGGIPNGTSRDDLFNHFKGYGHIDDLVIIKDKETLKPRGFGFIKFTDRQSFNKVMENSHKVPLIYIINMD